MPDVLDSPTLKTADAQTQSETRKKMADKQLSEDALEYHSRGRPGKIEVVPTKPTATARDLSLAYTPGVAKPCLEIAKNPDEVYEYTTKGNLVAVISNGTAVLGLGDIGPAAGKPVMEGKGVLFKRFADIDVFDIEIGPRTRRVLQRRRASSDRPSAASTSRTSRLPECFEIEERLKREMKIPVFHDDQHGTAIISARRALERASRSSERRSARSRSSSSGRGPPRSPALSLYLNFGVRKENLVLCDTQGRHLRGPHRGHEPVQGAVRRGDLAADARRRPEGRGCLHRPLAGGHVTAGHAARRWRATRSSSPSPIPIPRSGTRRRWPRGPT